ncbi:MAG: nickel pincer cofactor biosynthesis protein LarC [Leptolyngbyaceae cyanobacterium]
MKTLAFLDCPTGISGDMCLGAIVSAGMPLVDLQGLIARLNLPEPVELRRRQVRKNGIAATKVDVVLSHDSGDTHPPPARHLREIEHIIQAADLPARATQWSLAIFQRLAQAEGAIHGVDPQAVHFHEVGATDAIVDIVGTCVGLDWLAIDALYCAPLPTGQGFVKAAHGRLPVPAPAVLKLMEMAQVPLYNAGLMGELVTPTGAAIATELATHFGDPPAMQLQKVGLGAGSKELPVPNVLRLWMGYAADQPQHSSSSRVASPVVNAHHEPPLAPATQANFPVAAPTALDVEARSGRETVTVLETQIDDLAPQAIGYLYDRLFAAGALDVFVQAITMKKSRPGHLIKAIVYPEQADACEAALWRETTTLGVRRMHQSRLRLRRAIVVLTTPLGDIRMKVAYEPGSDRPLKAHPEYADCAALAQQHNLPWRDVHNQAIAHWYAPQAPQ